MLDGIDLNATSLFLLMSTRTADLKTAEDEYDIRGQQINVTGPLPDLRVTPSPNFTHFHSPAMLSRTLRKTGTLVINEWSASGITVT